MIAPPRRRATATAPGSVLLGALLFAWASGALADATGDRTPGSRSSTATNLTAPTQPSPDSWLEHLNRYRAVAGLPPVTESPALSRGDRDHAVYIVKNELLLHNEDPGNSWYTPEGQSAARQSNLFSSDDRGDTDRFVLDTWMQSPFHAVGVLDPRLVQVGFGSCRDTDSERGTGAALNVIAGIDPRATGAYPVFWPGDGASVSASQHQRGYPDPLTSCPGYTLPSGLPLILQIGPGTITPVVSASSLTRDGRPLEHCVFDETTYRNPDRTEQKLARSILGARDAIVLIPRLPLSPGARYTASVTVNKRTHTWSFSVDPAEQALGQQKVSGFHHRAE